MGHRSPIARVCFAAFTVLSIGQWSQAAVCATEHDRLVLAREKMLPNTPPEELNGLLRWLVESSRRCATSGDLWYYRSLVEQQLGKDAAFSRKQAKDNRSEALAVGFNPFQGAAPESKPFPPKVHERFALIVGVNKFKNANKSDPVSVGNLIFSVQDAQDFADSLVAKAGFKKENVTVLTDEKATLDEIRIAFGEIRSKAQEDDLVLLYFSSHGIPHGIDPTGVSYVLVHDTDLSSEAKRFATSIPMVDLADYSRLVRAKRFVLLLDTCYSGAAEKPVMSRGAKVNTGITSFTGGLGGMQYGGARIIASASRADEQSFENPDIHHGYFTYYLLKALDESQYKAPLTSVFNSVQKEVTDAVMNSVHQSQHPVMDQSPGGEKIRLLEP